MTTQSRDDLNICRRLAESGRVLRFDTVYTALGLHGGSELAVHVGPSMT